MRAPVLCTGATVGTSLHFAESGKKELKLSVWADDLILYVENPKESTKNKNKNKKLFEYVSSARLQDIRSRHKTQSFLYRSELPQ